MTTVDTGLTLPASVSLQNQERHMPMRGKYQSGLIQDQLAEQPTVWPKKLGYTLSRRCFQPEAVKAKAAGPFFLVHWMQWHLLQTIARRGTVQMELLLTCLSYGDCIMPPMIWPRLSSTTLASSSSPLLATRTKAPAMFLPPLSRASVQWALQTKTIVWLGSPITAP